MSESTLLHMRDITKQFPGVLALDKVSLRADSGKVMGLMGENGAGKSTLMKVLIGMLQADSGTIEFAGEQVEFTSPLQSMNAGIAMVHQELSPIPDMCVYENLFVGRELRKGGRGPLVDKKRMIAESRQLLEELGLDINPRAIMSSLSVAQTQLVEIARAISMNARLVILDEPTSAITENEAELLFEQIERLKSEGVAFIYISHKMDEVFRVCDAITVLRDGRLVGEYSADEITPDQLITLMVDREVEDLYPHREPARLGDEPVLLETRGLTNQSISDVSFSVKRGEILGFAGLVGAGRSEVMETLFGLRPVESGTVLVDGREVHIDHPRTAVKNRIAFVTEDRKQTGLNLEGSILENVSIVALSELSRGGIINHSKENKEVGGMSSKLRVKAPSNSVPVSNLSGGNQQKVVLAKWLLDNPKIIILDEPTRGIDVGAKQEIYTLINALADQGLAVLLISSEMPELIGMADRIVVMCEGRVTANLGKSEFSQETILEYASQFTKKAS